MTKQETKPAVLILNQMAGPITWDLAEAMGDALGNVALFTGHPDTLQKSHPQVQMFSATPYNRDSFTRRTLSWLHYWLQAFFWLWHWPKEIPLLLFSNPPILCWLGWLMLALRDTHFNVIVHDIYPDVLVRMSGFSEKHPLIRLWRWVNRRAYERADVVMTLGEYMAETLRQQFDPAKTKQGKIAVIYPWVDTEKIKPIPKAENWFAKKHDQVDKLTVMYSGNMGIGHDIETMLQAARQLQNAQDIHFMFIGAGPKWQIVKDARQNENLQNVTVLGWQPEADLPFTLATADIAFVSLEDEMQGLAVPSKTIFSMSSGSSLICLAGNRNEISDWIKTFRCGHVISPGDTTNLLAILQIFADDKKKLFQERQNSRQAAATYFQKSENINQVIQIFSLSEYSI